MPGLCGAAAAADHRRLRRRGLAAACVLVRRRSGAASRRRVCRASQEDTGYPADDFACLPVRRFSGIRRERAMRRRCRFKLFSWYPWVGI